MITDREWQGPDLVDEACDKCGKDYKSKEPS